MAIVELRAPTRDDVMKVLKWRNHRPVRAGLRTPYMLTEEMQREFYDQQICARDSNSRWWSAYFDHKMVGFGGLTGIQWENGLAEISLIIAPEEYMFGYGASLLRLLLAEGFQKMRLQTIFGECYMCSAALKWWEDRLEKLAARGYTVSIVELPGRKYWDGKLHGSMMFHIQPPPERQVQNNGNNYQGQCQVDPEPCDNFSG